MTAYIFLAEGFEEIEALTPVDLLRRAGHEIMTVSVTGSHKVTGANSITVETDLIFGETDFGDADFLITPGGMPGASNLHAFAPLNELLKGHAARGGKIAAICAAPAVVLAPLGLLDGRNATCYPGFENLCKEHGAIMHDERVVHDGNIITANGPSSATLFALKIIEVACGKETADSVASGILLYPGSMPYYF